jgi:two-component system, OmpR family, sensor histidine kinase KdpD
MSERERGKLKVYLGYAAGVGKTYQMLEDARQLAAQGIDVVVGYFEPHGRKDTIAKTEGLEIVPRKKVDYRGSIFEEMDTGAILARKPAVCVVDEFPHSNVPGSERAKRWQDVELLLDSGIDVLTTMNIQHLESLNDQVFHISGVRVRETIPDWVVERADQVVMIDVTPRALLNRLERGVVYERSKAERALQNFFQEQTLAALRELAMRQTAHEVEHRQAFPGSWQVEAAANGAAGGKRHRILVYVSEDPRSAMVIRRAKRVADFVRAECFALAVERHTGESVREAVEQHLNFARNLHIETRVIAGEDEAATVVEFARRNHITQIFLAKPLARGRLPVFERDLVQRIVQQAHDMQIVIVTERRPVRT